MVVVMVHFNSPEGIAVDHHLVMCMWLIQLITEYKYSPVMVISYQNGEDME